MTCTVTCNDNTCEMWTEDGCSYDEIDIDEGGKCGARREKDPEQLAMERRRVHDGCGVDGVGARD